MVAKRLLPLMIAVLGIALILGAGSASAADTGSIQGTVTLSNGDPAANATIELRNGDSVLRTRNANDTGVFSFSDIAPGEYTLVAIHSGGRIAKNVSVQSNVTSVVTLVIPPSADDDVDDDVIPTDDDDDDDVDDDVDDDDNDDIVEEDNSGLFVGSFLIVGFIILFIVALVIIGIVIAYNYSKITSDRLMEHETRIRIVEHIQKEPGQHLRKIGTDLDLPMGVLTHHIGKLEKEEVIKSQLDGKFKRYYPWDSKIERKPWLSEIQNDIMARIRAQPGISANDLVESIGGSRSNTYYHIAELEGKGLIRVDRQEKKHRCFPMQET